MKLRNIFFTKDFEFKISKRTGRKKNAKLPKLNKKFRNEAVIIILILGVILLDTLVKNFTLFHVPAALAVVVVPGYMLLRGFRAESEKRLPGMLRLGLMTALGIAWLMLFGLIADLILPIFGFKHPLNSDWIPLIFSVTTALLIPWSLKYKIPKRKISEFKLNKDTLLLSGLLLLTLIFTFCGTRLLNNGYSNVVEISAFVLGLVSIAVSILRQKHLPKSMFPIVLFVLSLACVWSYSLRSNYVFGWDIHQEFQVFQTTLTSGQWALGAKHTMYSAMLSLTILPVMIVKASGIAGITIFKVLSPIFFSFVPVILYYIYRLFTKRWISFLAALLIFAQFNTYMSEYSAIVRQQIGFIFFVAIIYLLLQNKLSVHAKKSLLTCFTLSLVVSHYTTAYLTIVYLGGTYILSKIVFALIRRYKNKKIIIRDRYVQGWVVVLLLFSAIIWYGPATHSSGYLEKLSTRKEYSHILKNVEIAIKIQFEGNTYLPNNTQAYLQTIGKQYHDNRKNLKYYPNASNATIHPVAQPLIKARVPILKTTVDAIEITLKYSWWVLAGGGISLLLISAYKKLDYHKFELAALGIVGMGTIVTFVLFPALQTAYSPQRLSEQVLIFTALPSVLMLIWLMRKLSTRSVRIIITCSILFLFAFGSGIITQFVGGAPAANLDNFGLVYNNYYTYQTDLVSASWLGSQYNSSTGPIYADSLGFLRLVTAKDYVIYNQVNDVTPETINEDSFVYSDYINTKLGVATSELSNYKSLTYQFPSYFLQQNKNLVYSNGYSEVYK